MEPSQVSDSNKKNQSSILSDKLKKFMHLPRSSSFEESTVPQLPSSSSTPAYSRTSSVKSMDSSATVNIIQDANETFPIDSESESVDSFIQNTSSSIHSVIPSTDPASPSKDSSKEDKKAKRESKKTKRQSDRKIYSIESDDLSNLSLGEYLNARRVPENPSLKTNRLKGAQRGEEHHVNMAEGDAAVHRRWVQHFDPALSSPPKKEEVQGEIISAATMERVVAMKSFFEAKYNKLFTQLKDGTYAPLEERRKKIRQEEEEKNMEILKKEAENRETERKKLMEAEKKRLEQERKKPELEEEERQRRFNEEQQRKQLKILLEENERILKEKEKSTKPITGSDFKAISPPSNFRRQFTIDIAESDDEGGQRVRNKDKKSIMQKMFRSPVNFSRKKGNNAENTDEEGMTSDNSGNSTMRSRSNSVSKVEGMLKHSPEYYTIVESPPKTRHIPVPSRTTSQIDENARQLQTMRAIATRLEKKIADRSKLVEAIRIRKGAVELLSRGTERTVNLHGAISSSEKVYNEGMMSLNKSVKQDSESTKEKLKESKAKVRKIAKKIESVQERVQDCQRFRKSIFSYFTAWLLVFFSGLFGKKTQQNESNRSENPATLEPKVQRRVRAFSKPPLKEATPELTEEEPFNMQPDDSSDKISCSDHLTAWARLSNNRPQLSETDLTVHKKGLVNMSEQLKDLLRQDELKKKLQKDKQLLMRESPFASNSAPDIRTMRKTPLN
eukprot:TRINITY_DN3415_c0_g1_i2.p1 TRINITY_DN3415_c0_g1~~TRINITY_DN3415_c0_g1_i2.p1  ORF type:complete len:728 (+),score=261.83 TRINITY_DN3415_c0_g1_i2:161-2344(+)